MPGRILLLDDEPELLRALVVRLTAAGFTCETASNGKEGLIKIQRWAPDLIITDLVMPELDGASVVRQLKAHERTATIPVIVLTAVPQQALGSWMAHLGTTRVMHKPFDSDALLSMIHEVMDTNSQGGPRNG